MRFTKTLAVLLASGSLLLVAACGGGDDDSSSSPTSSSGSSGGGDAAPTATSEAAAGSGGSSGGAAPSGDDVVGSVTIGDETWGIVANIQCDFTETEGGVPGNTFEVTVVAIAGHAEGDESVEISIDFDPRDAGLAIALQGGDAGWAANNEGFPSVSVGTTSISGEGTFDSTSSPGTTETGSFEARC